MTSPSRFYALVALLGVAGLAATTASALAASKTIELSLGSMSDLASACRQAIPAASASVLAALALAAIPAVVIARGALALIRELRAHRHVLASCEPTSPRIIRTTAVRVFEEEEPRAFCAGWLRPRIYISSGALARLSVNQLLAVHAHEEHHRRQRDPLRLLTGRVLAEALFFVPALRRAEGRRAAAAELRADDAALAVADRRALASALLIFGEHHSARPGSIVGVTPERVDHLLGRPAGIRIPWPQLAASVAAALGLTTAALLVAAMAPAVNVSLSALLAGSCMIAMTLGPAALVSGAMLLARRRRGVRGIAV